LFCRRDGCEL